MKKFLYIAGTIVLAVGELVVSLWTANSDFTKLAVALTLLGIWAIWIITISLVPIPQER